MALTDTQQAIGAVTHLLEDRLHKLTNLDITVGRPGDTTGRPNNARLNLFLYEAKFDPSLKNVSLQEGQSAPLWLVLHYILTPFDQSGESDTREAHINLGKGVRSLQDLSLLQLTAGVPEAIKKALKDNPEELKITFDDANSDLLSKLMQGTDERYRFSLGFQVRPVFITHSDPPAHSLLVGVNYDAAPPVEIGEKAIGIEAVSMVGPVLEDIKPIKFESHEQIKLTGKKLSMKDSTYTIDDQDLTIIGAPGPEIVTVSISALIAAHSISAGQLPVTVNQILASGRVRKSNVIMIHLLPTITGTLPYSLTPASTTVHGNLTINGKLLGNDNDDIGLALFKDGKAMHFYDDITGTPNQEQLIVSIPEANKPATGTYRTILLINGQQAKQSPEVNFP